MQLRTLPLLAVLLVSLCSQPCAFAFASTHQTTASRAVPATDSEIQQAIQAKLAKSKIGKDGFKFHVMHGVVTWEGTTSVMQHKGSATRMAKAAGASKVVNNIQVNAAAKAKQQLKHAAVAEN